MERVELRMKFDDAAALASEFDTNLRHGRAFVKSDVEVEVLSECALVLEHPEGATLELGAQVVMAGGGGIGIELRPNDEETQARIASFVEDPPQPDAGDEDSAGEGEREARLRPDRHSAIPSDVQSETRQQQIRNMSMTEQMKLARNGELSDRVMLERMLGKSVWEPLLANPRLTVPEVAKIARKGTVPKPLLDQIVDNGSWARASPVRRALLANPRVSGDAIRKLLTMTPKPELKLIVKGTAYPHHVRDVAKKLLS